MKKILFIVGICVILAAMPMTTAFPLFNQKPMNILTRHARLLNTNGSFTGEFAEKNESGYNILGEFSGTYEMSTWFGTFVGTWTTYEGNTSGTIDGWLLGYLCMGYVNITGGEEPDFFIGLYRVNTTDYTFEAGAIIFAQGDHYIRYAMGSLTA